jgi:hypothetical protein
MIVRTAEGTLRFSLEAAARRSLFVMPNVGAKGDSDGVTPGPEDRKCTPHLGLGPGGTPLLLPLERLVRLHSGCADDTKLLWNDLPDAKEVAVWIDYSELPQTPRLVFQGFHARYSAAWQVTC